MPTARILHIVRRAVIDDDFRARLFERPDEALAEYPLSAQELDALRRLKPEHLEGFVGGLVAHHFLPIRASRRFVVVMEGVPAPLGPADLPILVGPEIVFGNGIHATTQLCLTALEEFVRPGMAVLDIGTGTGVLAIAAARLGAAAVLALDILPEAVEAAQRNVERNGLADTIRVEQGSLDRALAEGFQADVITGNLLAPILISLAGQGLAAALTPGGRMILSGLLKSQRGPVEAALRKNGLAVFKRRRQGGWMALLARTAPSHVFWPF